MVPRDGLDLLAEIKEPALPGIESSSSSQSCSYSTDCYAKVDGTKTVNNVIKYVGVKIFQI